MITALRRCVRFSSAWLSLFIIVALGPAAANAAGPRVLAPGQLPNDIRLEPPKDLDGYFPFTPPASKDDWEKRAERVRRQILVSQGLWPMPTKMPLNAVIHGRTERDDYTLEKVYFESAPGFFVTGNLYRPKNPKGKVPGVLFAHGHWANARLAETSDSELLQEIATGQERFEQGGKSRFQSMCVQLARMGCVVWQWDMLGNADSQQLSMQLIHGFAKQRPEMNTTENWGLFSPQAEAHLQSGMGLQTWNSIRSLDFLLGLPEVDPERIAITGASGGGTQTMILAAIDPRVKLSFPAVMVSTAMQGGCTCENACLLRVGTGNVEFAGLFAPKPQGMTTANDWTKEMATKGFPELKSLYTLLGATDKVMLHRGEHFPHNYNAVSRCAFYGWLNRHFNLGSKEPVIERDYQPHPREQLTVWNDDHPKPEGGPNFERRLLRWFADDAAKQIREWEKTPNVYRQNVSAALDIILGRNLSESGEVEWAMKDKTDHGEYLEMSGLLKNKTYHEELPAIFLYPKQWNNNTVLWIDEAGKSALFNANGSPKLEIQKLLATGAAVAGIDLLFQGEFLEDGQPITKTRRVKNSREAASYTFGYNPSLFAQRVHDILTLVRYVQSHERKTERLDLVGLRGAGPLAAAARAQAGEAIDRAVIETRDFRFGRISDIHDVNFLPGGAKYRDLPGMLSLAAPKPLWIADEGDDAPEVVRAYEAVGAGNNLNAFKGSSEQTRDAAVAWLLGKARN
jgi:dienelactone hydrolase